MFQIISDAGCEFTKEEAKQFNVEIIPFYITFDGTTHLKDGIDITKDAYFTRLIEEKDLFPKTSQPTPQDYIDMYTPHLKAGKDILSFTISSKLSGTNNSARLAASMLEAEYPNRKIAVVDSLNASIGEGLILREIIKMRDAGHTLDETVAMAAEVIKSAHVYLTVDTLEYLKRGGRIGPTTALVGGILGLKPILQLVDGEVSQLDNVRGKKRVIKLMEDGMVAALSGDKENVSLCFGHIRNPEDAVAFKTSAETALGVKVDLPAVEIGVTIGTHAGPGALGFAYCKKYECLNKAAVNKVQTKRQAV